MMTYKWLHIPSGTSGERTIPRQHPYIHSREDLLKCLNEWNAKQSGVWQYWS